MSFRTQQWAKALIKRTPDLTNGERMTLMALGDKCWNDTFSCVISYPELVAHTNMSEQTLRRAVRKLQTLKMITVRGGSGLKTVITMPVPDTFDDHNIDEATPVQELTDAERKQLARDQHTKLTGEPWYAPCESEEEYNRLFAEFAAMTPAERFQRLREDIAGVERPLPYDKEAREGGVVTPTDRYKYDTEQR